jgi:hypothetical protein
MHSAMGSALDIVDAQVHLLTEVHGQQFVAYQG